jgi:4-alpha-glucanotransferase
VSDDAAVENLARRAGIAVTWTDAARHPKRVAPEALRRILAALHLSCDTPSELTESNHRIDFDNTHVPGLMTADAGKPIILPLRGGAHRARLVLEDGTRRDVAIQERRNGLVLPAIAAPGYHALHLDDHVLTLAVAPQTCHTVANEQPDARLWGLAVALYGLRRAGDGGIGDTGALSNLARGAAQHGAAALALSPTHALFAADRSKYSPYSPSSRLFLNPLIADPAVVFGADRVAATIAAAGLAAERARLEALDLIDWPAAAALKGKLLRHLFDVASADFDDARSPLAADFAAFRRHGGDLLERHAQFEALHAEQHRIDPARAGWRDWPESLRDPGSPAVAAFTAAHERDVTFHAFVQWVADRALGSAQAEARRAGMAVGLIADLAVGMESGGSHAWSRQRDVLVGLNVGAPPDLFNPQGQNWGLTTFSPSKLAAASFAPFLDTLRSAMRHAGGMRIDHAMGLTRLWLVPDGASPAEGAYMAYPVDDLFRLVRLESVRHRAIVIGEDLGTVPEGFRDRLAAAGIAGMDVLWFAREEDEDEQFLAPERWRREAVAMTSTHDLPTVAGWWRGSDIDLRERHALINPGDGARLRRVRGRDRKQLWDAFTDAGIVAADETMPQEPARAVDAAIKFIAATPSRLVLLPLEDALGLTEQPNLPGTITEHPNWRRRYPIAAKDIFDDPAVVARAGALTGRSRR